VAIKRGQSLEGVRTARTKPAAPEVKSRGKDQYFSRAVSKALETLEVLQAGGGPMALNEVAQRLQLSKTSTFRAACSDRGPRAR
jgi:hypothetical protein